MTKQTYPKRRDLDGIYFRVNRGGRWVSLCLTDLTPEEREEVTGERPLTWWRGLALMLADALRDLGDQLDVIGARPGKETE